MHFRFSKNIVVWVLALTFTSIASAQLADEGVLKAHDPAREPAPEPAREGGKVGLSVTSSVDYSDSDAAKVSMLPSLEYQWANGWYAGSNRGVGYQFSHDPRLQYGLGLGLDMGRSASATGALAGMGSIDTKVELGGSVNYALSRNLRLNSTLRYGSGNSGQGATANLGVSYSIDLAPQWRMAVGAATTWANAQYLQSYYGVTTAQSSSSGHAVYTPSAGLRDMSSSLNLSYQITPKVSIMGGIKASKLLGDASKSPTVTNAKSVSGSLSIGYAF